MSIRLWGIAAVFMLVAVCFAASVLFGKTPMSFDTVYQAFASFDGSREHLIVRSVRVPRALISVAVGCSLALAGAVMQALTRNALAGPEIFGINYGAALAMVLITEWIGNSSPIAHIWSALLGAVAAGGIVLALGSLGRNGLTPIRLVLAGATMNLLLASLTQGILILNQSKLDEMRFWLTGSLTGRDIALFMQVLPYLSAGIIMTFILSKQINLLSLGDDVAQGLGQRVSLMKFASLLTVMLLAGGAVAVAGPIGFVGLAVPHLARGLVGLDYRWILPYSALLGAILLTVADISARFVLPSQELSVGVVTAILGAPFLLYLAQRRG